MKPFIHENFLLTTDVGRRLFHETAAAAPIFDFHCHLDPQALAEDLAYKNLASLWVANDPYKHRGMRLAGIPERLITGDALDEEKFNAWARVLPATVGNPLFDWSALELRRAFGISELLNASNAQAIWTTCGRRLAQPESTARALLSQTKCSLICTSDNLLDDLASHERLARSGFKVRVLPSLRADDLLTIEHPHLANWLKRLGEAAGFAINTLEDWKQAVLMRLDIFSALGCRLADHSLDDFTYVPVTDDRTAKLFASATRGPLCSDDVVALRSGLLYLLVKQYASREWALQLHLGAQRRTSTRLLQAAGKAGGFAGMKSGIDIEQFCAFFDHMEQADALPRTIVYPLNPADYVPIATLTGSFPGDGVRGKLQLGPAWWYNDHALGIRQQLEALSSYGLLSTFVGMTTDSRSPLSIHRHEYFRRVLCDWIGSKVAEGRFPADQESLNTYVRNICFENIRSWLHLEDAR